METNRKRVLRILFPILGASAAVALLFAITGILRDPGIPEADAQPVKVAQQGTSPAVSQPATARDAGKSEETVAHVEEKEPFPEFNDEPSGS
jgi:hypothetical protein